MNIQSIVALTHREEGDQCKWMANTMASYKIRIQTNNKTAERKCLHAIGGRRERVERKAHTQNEIEIGKQK